MGSWTLNFASTSLGNIGAPGVQFGNLSGNKTSQALKGRRANEFAVANGEKVNQFNIINGITQLLDAIVQLLKGQRVEKGNKTGTDDGNAGGSGSNAALEASILAIS